jgi:hypothetical protein
MATEYSHIHSPANLTVGAPCFYPSDDVLTNETGFRHLSLSGHLRDMRIPDGHKCECLPMHGFWN